MNHGLEASVVDWMIDHPEVSSVLQNLRIDDSCAGKSLEYACQQRGLDPHDVLSRLKAIIEDKSQ